MFSKLKSKTGAVSVIVVTVVVAIILTAAIIAIVMAVGADDENPNSPQFVIEDIQLNVGKYYFNGDTQSYYYEVFDDKTIQLGGIDPLDYYWSFEDNAKFNREDKAVADTAKSVAENLGARKSYDILSISIEKNMIVRLYQGEPPPAESPAAGLNFIDINNVGQGEKVFTYVKE